MATVRFAGTELGFRSPTRYLPMVIQMFSDFDESVNSDVSYFRDTDSIVSFHVLDKVICHNCGFGEVYQPGQTMAMPMVYACLGCGVVSPSGEFEVGEP